MFKKRWNSFGYAVSGIIDLLRTQPNAQIHVFTAIATTILGFLVSLSSTEWCLIALCCGAVIAAEAFNTAIEYTIDLVSPEHHLLAGKAKDVAAGGVLITAISVVVVGVIIFLPKIIVILNLILAK